MRGSSCLLILSLFALALTPLKALPVQPIDAPIRPPVDRPVSPGRMLNQRAGLIFAGRVLGVQRVPTRSIRDVETIEISFKVEKAVRGVRTGQTLSIREWAGLWVARPRYRVGERVLLFLYPPSRLGLTSPVSDRGRFTITSAGRVVFSPAQSSWLGKEQVSPSTRAPDGLPLHEFLHQIQSPERGQP